MTDYTIKRILVLDDVHAGDVKLGLEQAFKGIVIDATTESAAALAKASESRYDVAVLDYNLKPWDVKGYNVAKNLRQSSPGTKLVGFSTSWDGLEGEFGLIANATSLEDLIGEIDRIFKS